MVPKELVPGGDLLCLMTTLEKAVLKKVGFKITLVFKGRAQERGRRRHPLQK